MKKKLLIVLAVLSMLICIFAISVSAKTITTVDGKELTVTTYDDAPAKTNFTVSTDDVVVFDDGFCCPSAYVFKDNKTKMWDGNGGNGSVNDALDFSFVNGKREKTYTLANIVEFDFPEGLIHLGGRAFQGITTIKRVSIPKTVESSGNAIFQGASNLEECVFEHGENDKLVKFPSFTFFGCKNLKYFSMPDCVTEMYDVAHFSGCNGMGAVHLSKNLVTWNSGGGGQRTATFDDCYAMYLVNEAFTPDNVPSKPEVYYFPKDLEVRTAGGDFNKNSTFRNCKNLNDVLVFGTKVTTLQNDCFFQAAPEIKVVFLADTTKIMCGAWGASHIYFANLADVDATSAGLTLKTEYGPWGGTAYYCNAEGNTNHLYLVKANTAPTCTENGVNGFKCFCGVASADATVVPKLGHEKNELLAKYFAEINGTLDYYSDMITEHSCTRCQDVVYGTAEASALFTKKGYSYSDDTSAFSYTVYVNYDAIKSYNAELIYGIVVSANTSGTPISYVDGKVSHGDKAIALEFQNTDVAYSIITAKLTNVAEGKSLHLSAYCVDGGKVSYLGNDTVTTVCEAISHVILTEKYPNGKEN